MTNKRKRRTGIGGLNPNPDGTAGVHISAIANPNPITTDYSSRDQPKEKKTRTQAPLTVPDDVRQDPKPQTPKRKQVFLSRDQLPQFLDATTNRVPRS
jgi:hypothetical protein